MLGLLGCGSDTYVCIYIYVYVCIYIYIYTERDAVEGAFCGVNEVADF